MNMELGTAKRVITPPRPVRLAGYATRTTPFDSVLEDIYVLSLIHISSSRCMTNALTRWMKCPSMH